MRVHEREAHRRPYSSVRDDYDQRRWNDVDDQSWDLTSRHGSGARDFDRTSDRRESDEDFNENFIEDMSFAGVGPKGYQRPNRLILEEANEALYQHRGVDATNVEVSVEDGIIMLDGTVATREMKRAAEEAVGHISGVVDVMNRLRIFGSGAGIGPKVTK